MNNLLISESDIKETEPVIDKELYAMAKISEVLEDLEINQRCRVLEWVADKFLSNDVAWARIEYKER